MPDSKFGTELNDIKNVYMLADEKGQIEGVYINYNNGSLDVVRISGTKTYEAFATEVKTFLAKAGATMDNKNSLWSVLPRNNARKIDFDELDRKFYQQKNSSTKQTPSVVPKISTGVQKVQQPASTSVALQQQQKINSSAVKQPPSNVLSMEQSENILNNNAEELERLKKKESKKERYKIKSVSQIFAHAKRPAYRTIQSALFAGASTLATLGAIGISLPAVIPIITGAAAFFSIRRTFKNFHDIHFDLIRYKISDYVSERVRGARDDVRDYFKGKRDEFIDRAADNVENQGRSR